VALLDRRQVEVMTVAEQLQVSDAAENRGHPEKHHAGKNE